MALSRRRWLSCVACGAASATLAPLAARPARADDDLDDENYELDEVSRRVAKRGRLVCPDVPLVVYRGDRIRYAAATKVYAGFAERLALMEAVIAQVAAARYGREPRRLVHLGAFNCRRMRKYPDWISEHGLGNALDVAGFDFGALPKGAELPEGTPKVFRGPFRVRVLSHWKSKRKITRVHQTFLHEVARKDIFRVLLGPSYPGHWNHFHFDCAPFRMVDIFDESGD